MEAQFDLNQVFKQSAKDLHAKVLIVEDDEVSTRFLVELLSPFDLTIIKADNGIEAYELFKEHVDIQMVLLDIRLPGLDGYKLAELFKKMRPDVPIIAQTAYGLMHDRQKCLDAGCDHYIKKPINIELFYSTIAPYLPVENLA